MQTQSGLNGRGEYVLATGDAAANRLRILHNVYGPGHANYCCERVYDRA